MITRPVWRRSDKEFDMRPRRLPAAAANMRLGESNMRDVIFRIERQRGVAVLERGLDIAGRQKSPSALFGSCARRLRNTAMAAAACPSCKS
jgi:hypothetical protein